MMEEQLLKLVETITETIKTQERFNQAVYNKLEQLEQQIKELQHERAKH